MHPRENIVLEMVKQYKWPVLAMADGCYCGGFRAAGFDVEVSCHKGNRAGHGEWGAYVHVYYLDSPYEQVSDHCLAIGNEIAEQLKSYTSAPITVCLKTPNEH